MVESSESNTAERAPGRLPPGRRHRIHCSYHKCLTVFFGRVMDSLLNRLLPWSGGYRHYNSDLQPFYAGFAGHRVASVNNRALDLGRLGSFRISRFVRDPRDLVVSGYFYHRRGAEAWTTIERPKAEDWEFANGVVPAGLRGARTSFARYLQTVPEEEGLLAELEFRRRHFDSMVGWPAEHPDIATWRYEDAVGREATVLRELLGFYGLGPFERWLGSWLARRYSLRGRRRDPHVRNPASGQWRERFTPRVRAAFDEAHPGLVERLGYPAE